MKDSVTFVSTTQFLPPDLQDDLTSKQKSFYLNPRVWWQQGKPKERI